MSWIRIDDNMADHPKVMGLGKLAPLALGLQMRALCWASRHLTDGALPKDCLPNLVMELDAKVDWPAAMVKAGLWEKTRAGYVIHDYLEYNPSRKETLAARKRNARRQRNFRSRTRNERRNGTVTRDNGVNNAASNGVSNWPVTLPPSPSPSPSPKTTTKSKSTPGGSAKNASPPPAPDTGAGDAPKPSRNGHPTWLTPYGQAWLTLYPDGEPPWGIMARWLRPLEKKHPPDVICAKMVGYFTTYGQYATWSKFAATLGNVKLAVDPKIAAEDAAIGAMARDLERRTYEP